MDIDPKLLKRRWNYILAILVVCLLILLNANLTSGQVNTGKVYKNTNISAKGATPKSQLTGVRLGTFPKYSRLVFLFEKPTDNYVVKRPEVDELWLDFGLESVPKEGRRDLQDKMIKGVAFVRVDNHTAVHIKMKTTRFSFRHFVTPDKKAIILDIRPGDPITKAKGSLSPERLRELKGMSLNLPDPKPIAREIRATMPAEPALNTDAAILNLALDFMIKGNYEETIKNLKRLWALYPQSKYLDPALFLLGEAYYQLYKDDLESHFTKMTDVMREAVITFPQSKLAPRGTLLLGLAYLKMKYNDEAIGYFKLVIDNYSKTRYAILARLYLGEAYLNAGEPYLAQDLLETVVALHPSGSSFLKVYFRLGQVYFQRGLFTKANEIFKEILDRNEDFYLEHPEILYYMGEGYFHAKRLDLARSYLYHLLNIFPEYQARDMALARIGDTYKEEGRNLEAKKIYRMTRHLYPDSTGAMISQLRLAEYGALRDTFEPNTIFVELKEGAREATIKMYQKIINSHQDSPLVQLAMFKIGLAAYWQKDYKKALHTFKDTLKKYPHGSIIPDVRIVMSKTILAQIKNLYYRKKYLDLLSYYFENQKYISEIALPDIRHYVALSHLKLDLPKEAIELFLANQGVPSLLDQRLLGLGSAYFKTGQYNKAEKTLNRFLKQYPNHKQKAEAIYTLAQCKMKQGQNKEALTLFEQAAAISPKLKRDGNFQNTLGRLYLEQGQYKRAAAALEIAAKNLNEGSGSAQDVFLTYTHLGRALAEAKQNKEAAKALDMALKIRPKEPFPEALYLIARTNFNLHRINKGLEALKLISKMNDPFWKLMASQELEARKWNEEIKKELKKEQPALSKES